MAVMANDQQRDLNFSTVEIRRYYKARAPDLKRNGDAQLRGPCPLHQGKDPNFVVDLATGRYFCHSQCAEGGDLLKFEMQLHGTDFPTARAEVLRFLERDTTSNGRPRIVARYEYRDEAGNVLYRVCRTEPKGFFQERPNGRGGWIPNLKGVRRVLYRLPELQARRPETVFFVEGEKDADELTKRGVLATTSPQGAGKWHAKFAESLRGREVVMIPDCDVPGRQHGAQVARDLLCVNCSVHLMDLADAKDVSEYFASGGTLEELQALTAQVPLTLERLAAWCQRWNLKDEAEAQDATEEIPTQKRPAKKMSSKGPSQAQILLELSAPPVAQLFHTTNLEAFADLSINSHRETWPIRSKPFSQWLVRQFYQRYRKPPGAQAIQDAIGVLEALAQFDCPESAVYTRVGPLPDNGICIDLCNDTWQAVIITPQGWCIVDGPPIHFKRSKGMLPLPSPTRGGNLTTLRKLINVQDSDEDKNWILLTVWLLAACRPEGPYPVLIVQGEQGAAKSTLGRFLKGVIDPSCAPLRSPPREERDLLIAANNSWIIAYDNLSGIPPWISDALCRLATGGGYTTRELYTDTEEVIFDVTRPIILNGIDHLPERPDLADRALILNLQKINGKTRREEKTLKADLKASLPSILGALLDALCAALARWPSTKLNESPRMADFARWAVAGEEPLALKPGAFLEAYTSNRADAVQEALEADPVAVAITALIEKCPNHTWTGSCKDLLDALEPVTKETTRKSKAWPQTARGISSRLRRAMTFLREAGTEIVFLPREGILRPVTITRKDSNAEETIVYIPATPSSCTTSESFEYPD
jgi:hypothetical protein